MMQIPFDLSCPRPLLRCVLLAPLLAAAIAADAAAQATWYVDLNGAPPGTGSEADPYVSIQQAIDAPATVDGDTILVAPGTYHETLDYHGRYLIVRSTDGPLATVLLPAAPSDLTVVTIGDAVRDDLFALLEGFTIRRESKGGPPGGGSGVRTVHGSQAWLARCIVTGHGTGCFNYYDLLLTECTVAGNGTGIAGDSVAIHYLANTICHQNGSNMIGGAFGPCLLAQYSCFTHDMFVQHCGRYHDNFSNNPRFWDLAGGDLHLRPDSPCIDAGDPADPLDPDGTRRDIGALTYDPFHAPGTSVSCYGSDALCPCVNGGSGAAGCDLAQGTGGIAIAIQDFTPDGVGGGTAEIVGTGYPASSFPGVTLIRSPGLEEAPVVFGDGLRCIAAAGLVRISAVLASGGLSLNPVMHGAGAGTYHYQLWARNTPVMFCDPTAGFNLSSALTVTWP